MNISKHLVALILKTATVDEVYMRLQKEGFGKEYIYHTLRDKGLCFPKVLNIHRERMTPEMLDQRKLELQKMSIPCGQKPMYWN